MGRPSAYTQDIADLICDEIGKGRAVRDICVDRAAKFDSIPNERTIYRWLDTNDEFRQQYARARETQADGKFEDAWGIARDATPETVQVARLQIDTIKWQTSKLAPKKYGEKLELEHSGHIDMDPESRRAEIARLIAKRADATATDATD